MCASIARFRRELDENPKLAADPLCLKMAEQIDKYGDKLFADPITVDPPNGPITIYPQRTNNILEQFFRGERHGYRRKTGSDSMRRTLQSMLADTDLILSGFRALMKLPTLHDQVVRSFGRHGKRAKSN